jgi:MspA protein
VGTIFRTVVVVVTPLFVCCGVAAADPVPIADVTQSADTDDGWHLSATLTDQVVNAVANMAATSFTREAFVSGKAVANIDGGGNIPVNTGDLVFGVQLGCEADVSQGGNIGLSGGASSNNFFSSGLSLSNLLSSLIPTPNISPNASLNLLPGNIKTLGLGTKKLKGRTGEITVHDAHVKVDGCTGIVAVRFFAYASISTDHGDDSVNAYGDVLVI